MRSRRTVLAALTAVATLVPAGTANAASMVEYIMLVGFIAL